MVRNMAVATDPIPTQELEQYPAHRNPNRRCPRINSLISRAPKSSHLARRLPFSRFRRLPGQYRSQILEQIRQFPGHHGKIEEWSQEQSRRVTERVRPDLLDEA